MPRKLYIQTRLYNVNDRLASLYLCEQVDKIIDQKLLTDFEHCYLPYRDSDAQLPDDMPEPGKAIFDLDVSTLQSCAGIIGNYDGVGYDSGCGFEIGLAYSYGYPVNLISTDFMKWSIGEGHKYFTGSPLLEHIAKIVSIINDDRSITDYRAQQENLRDRNMQVFLGNLIQDFSSMEPPAPLKRGPQQFDMYIDPCFADTGAGRAMYRTLSERLPAAGITYSTGVMNDPELCIERLRQSKIAIFYGDTFEHCQDSCILQGIAYGLGIPVIMVCSNERTYYDGRLTGKKNLMITQSTTKMIETVDQAADAYWEIINSLG